MFSIIIPLYNKAPYIEKAIGSILSQTFKEFELIVIDDGSTDNSLDVLKECIALSNLNCRIICQENSGVSSARNNGVMLAKYDYIAFLDADDWWDPNYLFEMKRLIDEFPMAALYGCSYYKVKNKKNIPADIKFIHDTDRSLINYFQLYSKSLWMPLWTGAVVIQKKAFVAEKGFSPKLKLGEDFDLWVRIAVHHPIAFLKRELAFYNQDVDAANRAITEKWYNPDEHMLFTNYGDLVKNKEFKIMFDNLAVYGLLPYYINDKNINEVNAILKTIDWHKQRNRYYFYYKILPKTLLKLYLRGIKISSNFAKLFLGIVRH